MKSAPPPVNAAAAKLLHPFRGMIDVRFLEFVPMPRREAQRSGAQASSGTVDAADVARFEALGAEWWDEWGPMRPLHKMNPVRTRYIVRTAREALGLPPLSRGETSAGQLSGLRTLDVGCGGGLLSESLAKAGARVTGIDPAAGNIEIAKGHAEKGGLSIDYRATTAEALLSEDASFDVVLALEVVEHVADPSLFLETLAGLARPGGVVILSTLNRTLKSFAIAIVGAEWVLRWLPRGTHSWQQFITPAELAKGLRHAGLDIYDQTGMIYNPVFGEWRLSEDCDVNYLIAAEKPV